jgi:hypothetical protein
MKVKVLFLDGQADSTGEVIDPYGVEIETGPVPVSLNFSDEIRDQLGSAILTKAEDGVYADITVADFWKSDEEVLKLTIPAVGGVCTERDGQTIKKCLIKRIGLSISQNCDKRIKSIAEQLATTK